MLWGSGRVGYPQDQRYQLVGTDPFRPATRIRRLRPAKRFGARNKFSGHTRAHAPHPRLQWWLEGYTGFNRCLANTPITVKQTARKSPSRIIRYMALRPIFSVVESS